MLKKDVKYFPLSANLHKALILSLGLILLNVFGDYISVYYDFPIWLDTFGTIIGGYTLGPFYSAIIGFISHILICIKDGSNTYIYAFANMSIGIIVAYFKKNNYFKKPGGFGACAIVCVGISLFISISNTYVFRGGVINNEWGNAVAGLLTSLGFPNYIAVIFGEFYIDFVDKVVLLFILYAFLKITKRIELTNERLRSLETIDTAMVVITTFNILVLANHKNDFEWFFTSSLWFKNYMLITILLIVAWSGWLIAAIVHYRELENQKRKIEELNRQNEIFTNTILVLAKTIDTRDKYTNMHSVRVAEYSLMIGKALNFAKERLDRLEKAAILHDIGKIGIPDSILNKDGKLSDEEYNIIRSHVTLGEEILREFDADDEIKDGPMYHHERWDGKGYPHHLKGSAIPIFARIMCIADSFDAMTSDRIYRKKCTKEYVISEFKRCKGTQFDPELCDIFLNIISQGLLDYAFK